MNPLTGTPVLLVNPGIGLSTAAVFGGWSGLDVGPLDDWRIGRNDLEAPAREMVPQIGDLIECLNACHGVTLARMSGSGATCFALFHSETARARAATQVRERFPAYWTMESVLR